MDKNDKDPSHNPERKTDLIIISPEELVKLGLFQDFSALMSSSTSPKTHTDSQDKSTASSSTTKKKSKTTPSKSSRKRSSTPKHGICFKEPETSPTMLPSSKQSIVSVIQPVPQEKHPPKFSKSSSLPSKITHKTASDSSRPVLKKNLEHVKQILTESLSRSRASSLAKEKTKKELKVISDNVVSFSSKELKDLIGKAKIRKDCISTDMSLTKDSEISGSTLYSNNPSCLRTTSSASTITQSTSKDLLPHYSQQLDSSLNDIHYKELEISSISSVLRQDERFVKYSSNDVKVELKKEIDGSDSFESDENNSSSRISKGSKQKETTTETKELDSLTNQNENLSSNKRRQQPRIPQFAKRMKGEGVNEIKNHNLIAQTSSIVTHNPELHRTTEVSSKSPEEQQDSSYISAVYQEKDSEVSGTNPTNCGKQEIDEEAVELISLPNELERSRELFTEQVNSPKIDDDDENTAVTKKADSIIDRRKRLHRKPLLVQRKKSKAELTSNNPVEDTSSTVKNTSKFNSTTDIEMENPVEHLDSPSIPESYQDGFNDNFSKRLSSDVKEEMEKETKESVLFLNKLGRSEEICTEQNNYAPKVSEDLIQEENTTVAMKVDSILDRRKRHHRKPLLVEKEKNKGEHTNSPVTDTLKNTSESDNTMDIEREYPVKRLLSSEQLDSSSIPETCLDEFYNDFAMRLSHDVKNELKKETIAGVSFMTASEKSPQTTGIQHPKPIEVVEIAPKVVNRRGRSRKSYLEISQLEESKETVEVLKKSSYEVTSEIKNTVDEFEDTEIRNTNDIQQVASEVIHCSTPLPKKRGRPKKNDPAEEKKGKKPKANDTESFTNEEKGEDTSTANEVILNDSSLLDSTQSAGKKGEKGNNAERFTNEEKDEDTSTANEVILNDNSLLGSTQFAGKKGKNANNSKRLTNEEKDEDTSIANELTLNDSSLLDSTQSAGKKGKKGNNTKRFTNEEKNEDTSTANEVILNDSSLLGSTQFAGKKGKNANNSKRSTNKEKYEDTSIANELTLNDSSLLGSTQSAGKKGKKGNNTKRFTNEDKDEDTSTANEVILNDSSLLGSTQSAGKKGKKAEANNSKRLTNEEKDEDTSIANELTLNDSSLLGSTQSAGKKGKKAKANIKRFTNEEKDEDTSTANEVIPNDSSLLGTTQSAGKKGKRAKANNSKRSTNKKKAEDTSIANEVIPNDSSLLGSTQSAGKKGKKANNTKRFTNEEKDGDTSTANEVILNDSSLLGTTQSAGKKEKNAVANNTKRFRKEEKGEDTSTAKEVILNDSSLLGSTQSAGKKGQKAEANNSKRLTNEEKDEDTSIANELTLNDSSLLGSTQSAGKKGKKANNTKRFTNEEKDGDTSTANEVILNDSSLLGTTQSAGKKGKRAKANNSKRLTNEKKDEDTSIANEVIPNDSSLLGSTQSAVKKGKKANDTKRFTNEEKDGDTSIANEVILNDSSLLGTTQSAGKKEKKAIANNTKRFRKEEKDEDTSTANEVILNDSTLLGSTQSAGKKEKNAIANNTKRFRKEEKDEDTSTANEVILNDSSLLGTTQYDEKKEKKSKTNISKRFKNEEKDADSSTANEITLNDSSLLVATQSDNDTTDFSNSVLKVVKKKGRPSKKESSKVTIEEGKEHSEVAVSYTIEKSRSGRVRKKLNYLELELNSLRGENVELAKLDDGKSHSLDVSEDFILPKKPRVYVRKIKTEVLESKEAKSNISTSLDDASVASECLDSGKNLYTPSLPKKCKAVPDASSDISGKCTAVPETSSDIAKICTAILDVTSDIAGKCTAVFDTSSDVGKKCTAVPDVSSDIAEKSTAVLDTSSDVEKKCTAVLDTSSDILEKCTAVTDSSYDISVKNEDKSLIDETENPSTTLKSKYVWNGYTTEMLNSVFSAAFRGDQDNPVTSSSSSPQELSGKKRRGRPKKYVEDISDNGYSDTLEVNCFVCEEKLPNSEWDYHNATRHYHLAWRKGDLPLNLDDDAVVKLKLKTVMVKSKKLTCTKCGHVCKDIQSFIIHRDECLGILVNGLVTCAVCNLQMDRQSWLNHKLKIHNNLAWRVGDFPLDLNDQVFVLSVLNALYKIRRPLFCDKCQQSKKSVVGFLSHRSQCGISLENAKVECKLCGKKVLPVSMPSHIKLIHETPKENPNGSDYFNVDLSASKKKRKAAKGAMLMIDSLTSAGESKGQQEKPYKTNPLDFKEEEYIIPLLESELKESLMIKCKFGDCSFTTDNVESTLDHLKSCSKKTEQFHICTICLVICVSETDIRQHVTDVHDVFLPNKEDSEEDGFTSAEEHEMEQTAKKQKKKSDLAKLQKRHRLKPLCIDHVASRANGCLFSGAFQFTWEFCSNHYSQPILYDKFRHFTWNLLPSNLINNYLPLTDDSCDVARIRVSDFGNVLAQEHTFKRFDLFEVQREDEFTTIFCGGPISAMAWAPTPHTSREAFQVLAVATTKDFDSKYRVNATYEEPSVIQFWDFGRLANRGPYPEPSQMLLLAFEYGPVWHMEWCPSGCYDQADSGEFERLGLLAVAGSVPAVFIYSIPMIKDEEKRGLLYKEEPLLKLQIHPGNTTVKTNFFPTKISWTKASGHKYIAVGYSDGMVALFNVESPSPLLINREPDGGGVLLPYRVIPAHKHYISALSLVHLQGGDKLLLTGSYDKDVHMWNLDRRTKITSSKKRIITDGTWLTNWLSYVTTTDDSNCVNNLTSTTVSAYRNYLSDPTPIMFSKSAVNSITASDWLNGFVQGNEVGEVQASFQGQMLYSLDAVRKSFLRRFLISYTKLIDKHKSPEVRVAEEADKQNILTVVPAGLRSSISAVAENSKIIYNYFEPITYAGARKKYGLVFCDFELDCLADFPQSFQKKLSGRHDFLETSKPNLYNLQAANKVCFNPNRQASLYFATGYQAGFVRVSYLKFWERDEQIRRSM